MTNDRGMPGRVPREMLAFVAEGAPTFEMHKVTLPDAPAGAFEQRFDGPAARPGSNGPRQQQRLSRLHRGGAGGRRRWPAAGRRRPGATCSTSCRRPCATSELVGRTWPHEGGWAYRLGRPTGRRSSEASSPASDEASFWSVWPGVARRLRLRRRALLASSAAGSPRRPSRRPGLRVRPRRHGADRRPRSLLRAASLSPT